MADDPQDLLLSFREIQALLINNGYDMPKYGADGLYGSESAAAFEEWGRANVPLDIMAAPDPEPPVPDYEQIVPQDWMSDCDMQRVILHWTAGASTASQDDTTHYHILVEKSGKLIRGTHTIADNVSTSDGDYAAHTKDKNTGSVGVALCGMAGAIESPFYAGASPITKEQWIVAAHVVADCCKEYSIPVDKTHVLSHGRVQANLGVAQSGKWDVCELPWDRSIHQEAVDEEFRAEVKKFM